MGVQLCSQTPRFIVKRTTFSSSINDEFSPVFYNGGIVYCSNIRANSMIGYSNDQNRLFKIVYVPRKDSTGWKKPRLFSKEITSGFNDGTSTFGVNGDVIYYSRNNNIESKMKSISDPSNKLGIYSAELVNGIWTNIKSFKYNNPLYSFVTPSLTPDGNRIYFSSDMPDGYGGMDIYYCDLIKNEWGKPINLGSVINTEKNESFAFAGNYGKLYFASDRQKGLGGKDIYFTMEINGTWIVPVNLGSPINSSADDFGFVTNSTSEKGYFSSNRLKSDDVFSFSSAPVEFESCNSLKDNKYCYTFYDEQLRPIDTIQVKYVWDFGDGLKRNGLEVKYCFPGPGDYTVKLSIIDELTGNSIAEDVVYKVELNDIEQVYINSSNVGIAGKPLIFDALKTNLKDFVTTDYLWNFGDGFKSGGSLMSNVFKKEGDYLVKLGLLSEEDSTGIVSKNCIMKKVRIFKTYEELELNDDKIAPIAKTGSVENSNTALHISINLMDNLSERQKTQIKIKLKEPVKSVLAFNQFGILPSSFSFLDNISDVLKSIPDLRLEMVVFATKDEIFDNGMRSSEKLAQELAFYFKNKDNSMDSFVSKALGMAQFVLKPIASKDESIDGTVEFIFMKY